MSTIQAKKQTRIIKNIDLSAKSVTFVFSESPELEAITIKLDDLNPEIQLYAALAGLGHKIGDAAAMDKDPATGKSATPDVKRLAMVAMVEQLQGGNWNKQTRDSAGSQEIIHTKRAFLVYMEKQAIAKFGDDSIKVQEATTRAIEWFDRNLELLGKAGIITLRNGKKGWHEEYTKLCAPPKTIDQETLNELDNLI